MKATVELSDLLFEQAKFAARGRGITLKALTELDRRVAIHPGHADHVAAFEFGEEIHPITMMPRTRAKSRSCVTSASALIASALASWMASGSLSP